MDEDGTRTSAWVSEHPKPPLRVTISVCGYVVEDLWNGLKGGWDDEWIYDFTDESMSLWRQMLANVKNDLLTQFSRQEVPFHWSRLHPWPYLNWYRCLYQDAPNAHYPPRIPPFHPQVRQI